MSSETKKMDMIATLIICLGSFITFEYMLYHGISVVDERLAERRKGAASSYLFGNILTGIPIVAFTLSLMSLTGWNATETIATLTLVLVASGITFFIISERKKHRHRAVDRNADRE